MKLNNKAYDILKWIALVALDAFGVFYKTIGEIWNLPYGNEVLATCAAISILIGALIGVSTAAYHKDQYEYDRGMALQAVSDDEEEEEEE